MTETAPSPRPELDVPPEPPQPGTVPAGTPSRTTRREPLWRHLVGERLRHERHERGETLDETARRAGISPQYLSEVERGVKEPSSEMIAAMTGALDLTLVDLVSAVAERLVTTGGEVAVRGQVSRPTCRSVFALAA